MVKERSFALAQLVSMKRYFEGLGKARNLMAPPNPELATFFGNASNQFTVTGYSLSGRPLF